MMPLIPESIYNLFKDENSVNLERFRVNVTSAPMLFKINFCSFAYNKCKVKYRTEEVSMADQRNFEKYLDRGTVEVYEMFKSIHAPDEAQRMRGLVCFYGFLDRIDVVMKALAGDINALEHTRMNIQLPTQSQTYQHVNIPVSNVRTSIGVQQIIRNARLRRRIEIENEIIDLTLSNEPSESDEVDEMESNNQTESMGSRNLEHNNNNNSSDQGTECVNELISEQFDRGISSGIGNINGSEVSVIDLDDYTDNEENVVPDQYRNMRYLLRNSREQIPRLLQLPSINLSYEEFAQYAPYLPVEPVQQPAPNVEGTNSADPDFVNGSNEPTGEELHAHLFRYSPSKLNEFVMNRQASEVVEEKEIEVIEISEIVEDEFSDVVEEINGNGNGNVQEEMIQVSIENNTNEVCVEINNGDEEGDNNVIETIGDNIQVLSLNSSSNNTPSHLNEVENDDDDDEFFSSYSNASHRKRESNDGQDDSNKKIKCQI